MLRKAVLVAGLLLASTALAGCGAGGSGGGGAGSGTTGGGAGGGTGGGTGGGGGGGGSGGTPVTPMPLPSGPVGGPRAEGIDVSKWQGTINWTQASAGLAFAVARVSDGINTPDTQFAANWSSMKARGLVRGVYQFFRSTQDPIQQADYLISQVGALGPGDLPPFLDAEWQSSSSALGSGVTASQFAANMTAWIDRVKSRTGLTPAIYTSRSFWNELANPTSFWASDLWVANWGVTSPALPPQWKDWTFWQYSASGTIAGVSGNVDLDRFHGTADDLDAYAGLPVPSGFFRGLTPDSTGNGYWCCTYDGGVFAYGDATFRGTAGGNSYPEPFLGIVRTPTGFGYWLFGADGNVLAYGDAVSAGNLAGQALAAPIVGMAATATGRGYWLAGRDGKVFPFGDAQAHGQPSAQQLTNAVVGIAATPTGLGYWIASADGNVYNFGDAVAAGSLSGTALSMPIVGIAATRTGLGYWLAGADGIVSNFGDAGFHVYQGSRRLNAPIVGIAATLTGLGYWLLSEDGTVFDLGDAVYGGSRPR